MLIWLGLIVSAVLGCGGESGREDSAVRTAGDTIWIDLDAVPRLSLEPELRLDGYERDLVPFFGGGGVIVDRAGGVALLQPQDYAVRFFSPDGEEEARIGSEGDGPGEFRDLNSSGLRADTLWVFDSRLRRISLLHAGAGFIRSIPISEILTGLEGPPIGFFFPRALFAGDSIAGVGPDPELPPGTQSVVAITPGSAQKERLLLEPPGERETSMTFRVSETLETGIGIPFVSRPDLTFGPNGDRIVTVRNEEAPGESRVAVRVHDGRGTPLWTRELRWAGIPIPDSIRDRQMESRLDALRSRNVPGIEGVRRDLDAATPRAYEATNGAHMAADGSVWLRIPTPDPSVRWLILNEDGEVGGQVRLPPRSFLNHAADDRIWVVEADSFDVESVVRYRVQGGRP